MKVNDLEICHQLKEPIIVALIGSTKYKKTMLEISKVFQLNGHMCIHTDVFTNSDGFDISEDQQKTMIINGHKRIDIADLVYVVNENNYIGDSTREEIEYAKSHGKRVEYFVPIEMELNVFVSTHVYGFDSKEEVSNRINDCYKRVVKFVQNQRVAVAKHLKVSEKTKFKCNLVNPFENKTMFHYTKGNDYMKDLAASIAKLSGVNIFVADKTISEVTRSLNFYDRFNVQKTYAEFQVASIYEIPIIVIDTAATEICSFYNTDYCYAVKKKLNENNSKEIHKATTAKIRSTKKATTRKKKSTVKKSANYIPIPDNFGEVYARREAGEITAKEAAKLTCLALSTYYNKEKEYKELFRNKKSN